MMPKRGQQKILNCHPMERNSNSSGGCHSHRAIAVVASEKPSISPSAFTFAKGMARAFQMYEFITLSCSRKTKLQSM